ncbi:tetratricopeptide repeat-containing sensor histidine kinase [Roseivirga ehrenbergii]|uniref:tetratricopeptide repeat-containing sensor histidine kinase n=1 Tax=Roseivirga ehrenbergii (strain DSM 102268 / JCM 13514 / KCTC 12282 / NCIMB 14502 / KMM 6017) TaxID=279360 RepID=UPI0014043280|nr:sensor histidine kinase [Roseivirga ehrenbergii]
MENLRKQGEKYRAESKYDSALIAFRQVNDLAEEMNNVEFQVRSAIGVAAVFIELGQSDFARTYYLKAIKLSQSIDNGRLENNAWYGIGVTHQIEENLDSALFYYNKTKVLFDEEKNKEMVASLLSNIGSLHYLKEEYDLAIAKSYESSIQNKELNNFRVVGLDYRRIGMSFFKLNNLDSAKVYANLAYEIADSLKYLDDAREVLTLLSEIARSEGEFEEAARYTDSSDSLAKVIYVNGKNDEILELKAQVMTASLALESERQKNLALQQRKYKTIILVVSITLVVAALIMIYVINQRRKNIKTLAEKNEEINKQQIDELLQKQEITSLQGVLEGQETERRRIAIDLHDRLGGILSMVKLHFSVVTESLSKDDQAHAKFMKASDLLDQATGEVRSISHNLMSGVLTKFGLVPALEDLKDKISQTGKLKVSLYSNDLNNVLTAEQELQLYRIVQELISNILKHSHAKEANIQLTKGEDSVNLIVEDDGVGFDLKEVNKKTGIGLINLKARVSKLNGNFHIDSGRGAGTTISIDIPINND